MMIRLSKYMNAGLLLLLACSVAQAESKSDAPLRVMCLGDSITCFITVGS